MGSVGESPHLPQSQLSSSLGLRLSGEATVSDMSLVCTDMEPTLPLPLPPTSPPSPTATKQRTSFLHGETCQALFLEEEESSP